MKKVASILAVALFTLGMFATAVSTIAPEFSDISNAIASDDHHQDRDERDG
ncbi:hypothetical protein [uncultured Maribacter sp.]|uniref:hypothetical protein n=1 Tax=uncultured Maribacter sp. TaxID=431308 RepID=UPI00261A3EA1|nr:hypothetical protein [uncultured Maribacter sp.]